MIKNMIWCKLWYKIAAIILSNDPVSGDSVPYTRNHTPIPIVIPRFQNKRLKSDLFVALLLGYFSFLLILKSSMLILGDDYVQLS